MKFRWEEDKKKPLELHLDVGSTRNDVQVVTWRSFYRDQCPSSNLDSFVATWTSFRKEKFKQLI